MPESFDPTSATFLFAAAYVVLTLLAGALGWVLGGLIARTEVKETPEPLTVNTGVVRSEIRTMGLILRMFVGFNVPVATLFVLSFFAERTFLEYCAGVAFSTFVLVVALFKYWKKKYVGDQHIITYLLGGA